MRRFSTQTLGIFGFGKIAKLVAKKARGFGFRIIATDPYVSQKEADEYGVELVDFDTVLRESDIMTINMPLTAETKHKFNLETFKKMKKTGRRSKYRKRAADQRRRSVCCAERTYHFGGCPSTSPKKSRFLRIISCLS